MHDFEDMASALHSEQTLCSNPAVSNVHIVIYLLFSIFCRLPGGTPLSPTRLPYDGFPYGLTSLTDAYARRLQRMPTSPPLTSKFMGMASYAPTCFLDLMDDDVESDDSSIGNVAPSHRPSWECAMADAPRQPPAVTPSLQTHAPPDPHAETLELTREHGEEPRQQLLHQPPTAPVRSTHHTAPCARRPASGARVHACWVQHNTMDWGNDPP